MDQMCAIIIGIIIIPSTYLLELFFLSFFIYLGIVVWPVNYCISLLFRVFFVELIYLNILAWPTFFFLPWIRESKWYICWGCTALRKSRSHKYIPNNINRNTKIYVKKPHKATRENRETWNIFPHSPEKKIPLLIL